MVYSAFKQFVGYAKEVTPGTPVAMTKTMPVTKADFEDKPHELPDKSWSGSLSSMYGLQQGVIPADFSFSGNVYADTIVDLLVNIMGDRTTSGGGTATTTSAAVVSGATTISTAATIPAGTVIGIDSGVLAETRTVTAVTGAGPYTLTVAPLLVGHASGVAVTPLYSHAVSLLNSGQGQPVTHTFTHYMGPGPNGARVYPGACLSDLSFKFNAMSQLFEYDAKGSTWPSQAAAAPVTANPSAIAAVPSWKAQIGIGGPVSTASVNTIMDGDISIKRKLDPEYTLQGSQNPAAITRGELDIDFKLTVLAADDSAYQYMRQNTQPALQLYLAAGGSVVQIDLGQAAYVTAKPTTSKTAIEYAVNGKAVINAANAGASGGRSPGLVTVSNGVPGTSY